MSITQKCLICKEGQWHALMKDFVTGLVFCKDCHTKIEKEYKSLIGGDDYATWFRAIANVLEEKK